MTRLLRNVFLGFTLTSLVHGNASAQLCADTGADCSTLSCCEGSCEEEPVTGGKTCRTACEAGLRQLGGPGQLAIGRIGGDGMRWKILDNKNGNFDELTSGGHDWGDGRGVTAMAWGDIDGDGLMELAVGRNPGNNSRVLIYDDAAHDFALLSSLGDGWGDSRGVVSLAFGDTNGDGKEELVVGRNAGGNSRVIVYSFEDGAAVHIQSWGEGWGDGFAASAITLGNIDEDPQKEVIVGRSSGGNARVMIFDDMLSAYRLLSEFGHGWGDSRGVQSLAVGDIDKNGRVELAVGRNAGDNMRVSVYQKAESQSDAPFEQVLELGAGWGDSRAANALSFGDFDSDGFLDLAVGRNAGGNDRVIVFGLDGAAQVAWSAGHGDGDWGDSRSVTRMAAGDFDADGIVDLAVGRNAGGNARVLVYKIENGALQNIFSDGDQWGDAYSVGGLAFLQAPSDRDGDGLLDVWETSGLDADCDGIVDVPLNEPPFNSDINHKDLFLEFDWMVGQEPTNQAVQALVRAFSLAPVDAGGISNPDGQIGITLHVDTGDLNDPLSGEGGVVGNCNDQIDNDGDGVVDEDDGECPRVGEDLGGGNSLNSELISRLDARFYQVKAANFDQNRRFVFRYGMSAVGGPGDAALSEGGAGPNTCGNGFDDDGDLLSDFADPDCRVGGGWGEVGGNDFIEYNHDGGTIMHELGHTLRLGHGGAVGGVEDPDNCKPNHISVMNYDYQFGIPQNVGSQQGQDFDGDGVNEIIDFAPARHSFNDGQAGALPVRTAATANLATLTISDNALQETWILDSQDPENMMIYTNGQAIIPGFPGAAAATELGAAAASCTDGTDNDGDGLVDGYNPTATEVGGGSCSDGNDNDGNGVADQFDPACQVDIDCVGIKRTAPLDRNIDWSGDGIIAGTVANPVTLFVDIDKEGALGGNPADCRNNQGLGGRHQFSNDWNEISLPFVHFGDSADGPINPVDGVEPTLAELLDQREQLFATDLSIEMSTLPDPVEIGGSVVISLSVRNNSGNVGRGVRVFLELPTGVQFVSSSVPCDASGQNLECDLSDLGALSNATVEVLGQVGADIYDGDRTLTSRVELSAGIDPDLGNNSDQSKLRVAWAPGMSYNIGDEAVYQGIDYACRQAHTALAGWEPPITFALWERVITINPWAPQVIYQTGDLVEYQGAVYRAVQGHQSQLGWEPPAVPALWELEH